MTTSKKTNYQKELDKLLPQIDSGGQKPSLLLHACCGPCSSYVLEYLCSHFEITVLFYNPNIYPAEEYLRRLNELLNFYKKFVPAQNVKVIQTPYEPEDFYTATGVREKPQLATEPEQGERCRRCYELRLRYTYEYACANNFDYFCTTLSISPFKDADMINEIGEKLAGEAALRQAQGPQGAQGPQNSSAVVGYTSAVVGHTSAVVEPVETTPRWLPSDFKKKNGFKRSLELSAEYDLYRQEYCGCVYSIQTRTD